MSNEIEKVRDIAKNCTIDAYLVGIITGGGITALAAAMTLEGPWWVRVLAIIVIALGAWGFGGVLSRAP